MIPNWKGTCSVDNPKDVHLTFARNREYLSRVCGRGLTLGVFVPQGIPIDGLKGLEGIILYPSDFFEYEFAALHNEINKEVSSMVYGMRSIIHPTVIFCDGIREVNAPDGSKLHMKHVGNVIIGDDVRVGPYSFIERAVFDSTIIMDGVRIDAHCGIGHNARIGKNVVIASGVGVGGSAVIGDNVWIGGNAYVRNGVKICPNVVIGCCSGVVKDITEPGIYGGVPAKFIKPIPEGYNF